MEFCLRNEGKLYGVDVINMQWLCSYHRTCFTCQRSMGKQVDCSEIAGVYIHVHVNSVTGF